jgi:hypothetical protein
MKIGMSRTRKTVIRLGIFIGTTGYEVSWGFYSLCRFA